jgi:enoyl-CoA hydratase/carnithine racemase
MTHQIRVEVSADHVATVEFENGARNHFDAALIAGLADTFERLDADGDATADFVEGVSATAERREPRFTGS